MRNKELIEMLSKWGGELEVLISGDSLVLYPQHAVPPAPPPKCLTPPRIQIGLEMPGEPRAAPRIHRGEEKANGFTPAENTMLDIIDRYGEWVRDQGNPAKRTAEKES